MAENVITAEAREREGRGASRAARRAGRVPAIIYGAGQDPVSVTIDRRDVVRELDRGGFYTRLYSLDLGSAAESVLPREVQYHPVTDVPIHVDFLRTSADTEIHVFVPVQFLNEDQAPGIKRGGVLNIVRHEIEVYCLAGAIPDHFTVDLAGLDIGDAMRFSNIPVPEGVRPVIAGRDFTVATISASSAVMDEAAAAAAAAAEAEGAEGEVVEGGAAPAADGKSEG